MDKAEYLKVQKESKEELESILEYYRGRIG